MSQKKEESDATEKTKGFERTIQAQNRFKSPVLWTAVAAQLLTVLVLCKVIDTGLSTTINGVIAAVLQLLVLFGVFNNPSDKLNY
jgi:uncharacterized membrane protein